MAQNIAFVSDLTGKEIADDSEHASLVILQHPTIDSPVRLDAHALEAAGLKDESLDLIRVEIQLPNYEPETVWLPLAKFDKLFGKAIDSQEVLTQGEPVQKAVTIKRGRPAGSTNKPAGTRKPTASGKSAQELAAVRAWAETQGIQVASWGRIKAEIMTAYDEAHAPR